jgi:ADP-ribose pyrophosphatase YjhB (NUDIX family)
MDSKWIEWAMRIQGIAQAGRTYSENVYDIERYKQLQDLAAEILAEHSDHDFDRVQELLEQETGYATPKLDVRGVVFQDDRILLVRETADGLWSLPGGWADCYASPSENVVREIREESGYETIARRILALYDRSRHNDALPTPFYVYKLFVLCELIGGSPTGSIETSDVGFFDLNDLPPLSAIRVTEDQIRRMAVLRSSQEVDFD